MQDISNISSEQELLQLRNEGKISEIDKDRCQSGQTFEICDISDGRGHGIESVAP